MALNWQPVNGNFEDTLFEILKKIEAPKESDRLNLHIVDGNPTIGTGFDLAKGKNEMKAETLKQLGFDKDMVDAAFSKETDAPEKGTAAKIEYDYIIRLKSLMVKGSSISQFTAIMKSVKITAIKLMVSISLLQTAERRFHLHRMLRLEMFLMWHGRFMKMTL